MRAYRYMTGPDDSAFCMRVTEALNRGWELAGPATLAFDPTLGRMICGQPLTKDIPDTEFSADIDLSQL